MKSFTELEFRGYEEKPYQIADGGRIISGVSKSLTFLDEDMQTIKVAVPKDCTVDFSKLKEKENYSVELKHKMTPVVTGNGRIVSQKQFTVYYEILNIMPFNLNNSVGAASPADTPVTAPASTAPGAPKQESLKKGGKTDERF